MTSSLLSCVCILPDRGCKQGGGDGKSNQLRACSLALAPGLDVEDLCLYQTGDRVTAYGTHRCPGRLRQLGAPLSLQPSLQLGRATQLALALWAALLVAYRPFHLGRGQEPADVPTANIKLLPQPGLPVAECHRSQDEASSVVRCVPEPGSVACSHQPTTGSRIK